ncbi:uncharacterized protein BDCG_04060 [Blastomyces dermatitidis ER-3]|uniref:Adaptin ear-binding coat-associated protein n=2 Tax=Ajellomyces dermatitidis TaxID=5039 RepID=F2TGE5_AJEDA|nr:uncharacterized protein BDCG_04060 [Blastomyces dermatitidis ER-3]EEQ88940.1 hypothetical protein BDCG_04060 [Blastomyces dermatitidis ER-3]EGE82345.1 adaptin ear-binding coat-associated protein [Blastomyces dermatitidis ATCC 18188]EQL32757.1 hypothetical protein BDFG_05144 [Blastomyces dermatitidis ATCC 26199]
MSGQIDPATGKELPNDAIQRVLFICHPVHVYAIPPLTSMKGYAAADWTVPDPKNNNQTRQIFTARLRIIETAITLPAPPQPHTWTQIPPRPGIPAATTIAAAVASPQEKVKVDIVLEDPSTGNLFAAAPYTDPGAVEHAIDSSRFFAIRVMNDGRKAILGIGFEDRSEAFDFGVTLQEARKVLGFAQGGQTGTGRAAATTTAKTGRVLPGSGPQQKPAPGSPAQQPPRDYSLKPGQTISINIGGKKPNTADKLVSPAMAAQEEQTALFSLPPPPAPASRGDGDGDSSSTAFPMIAPPPSGGRSDRRRRPQSMLNTEENKVVLGFGDNDDDGGGEFGEFQS